MSEVPPDAREGIPSSVTTTAWIGLGPDDMPSLEIVYTAWHNPRLLAVPCLDGAGYKAVYWEDAGRPIQTVQLNALGLEALALTVDPPSEEDDPEKDSRPKILQDAERRYYDAELAGQDRERMSRAPYNTR